MESPDDEVPVLFDYRREVAPDRLIRVNVLDVPESAKFPEGIKYRMHFGRKDGTTLLRCDNSHGHDEQHTENSLETIEFPGLAALYDRFRIEIERMRQLMTQERTLTVVVETESGFYERVRERLARIDGGTSPDPDRLLSVESTAAIDRILREPNLELIRAIAASEPESMRAAARLVGRDIKDVSRNLHELAELGVIDLEPAGQSKRPVVWYEEIGVRVPVGSGSPVGNRSETTP